MRLNDRTMTILTGLTLAVVVGVIANFSSSIMNMFADTPTADVEDDFFLVRADRAHSLDLVINDTFKHVDPVRVHVTSPPRCGALRTAGTSVVYDGGGRCAGTVTFAYCIAGVENCAEALVTLNVRPGRAPESVPETAVGPPKADVAIAPEKTTPQTPASKPALIGTALLAVTAPPDLEIPSQNAGLKIANASKYLADTHTLTFETKAIVDRSYKPIQTVSTIPLDPYRSLMFVDREAAVQIDPFRDQGEDLPLQPISLDNGTVKATLNGCAISIEGRVSAGAEIDLNVSAPCFRSQLAQINQRDFAFGLRLDREGNGSALVPALSVEAEIDVTFPGYEVPVVLSIRVPELARLVRSVASIEKSAALNLAAREYSAEDGSRLVQARTSVDVTTALAQQRGYIKAYLGGIGHNVFVYTHPLLEIGADKTVELTLRGASDKACGRRTQVALLDTRIAKLPAQQTMIDLPGCKLGEVYENTLRDVALSLQ